MGVELADTVGAEYIGDALRRRYQSADLRWSRFLRTFMYSPSSPAGVESGALRR
jgi:hypothetical protein